MQNTRHPMRSVSLAAVAPGIPGIGRQYMRGTGTQVVISEEKRGVAEIFDFANGIAPLTSAGCVGRLDGEAKRWPVHGLDHNRRGMIGMTSLGSRSGKLPRKGGSGLKTAVVTGGASGIGRAVAERLRS